MELNFIIPGVYSRSYTRISARGTTVDAWTGLGSYHLGLGYAYAKKHISTGLDLKIALPSGDRSQIDAGDFESGIKLFYKNTLTSHIHYKAGLITEYKSYHWKQLEGELRQDFTVSPVVSLSTRFFSGHELSFNYGVTAYSWVDDELIKDPSGRMFIGLYSGWYF